MPLIAEFLESDADDVAGFQAGNFTVHDAAADDAAEPEARGWV